MQHKPQPLSNQDAFNNVWQHFVVERNSPSIGTVDGIVNLGNCRYRMDDGTNGCAIGCQLPDELYHPSLEGKSVAALYADFLLDYPNEVSPQRLSTYFSNVELYLLECLQGAHDNWARRSKYAMYDRDNELQELEIELRQLARQFKLEVPNAN